MADPADAEGPVLRFRNYKPQTDELQRLQVEKPAVPTIEEQVGSAEILHNDATQEPLLNLAPKKANWDLKRDIEPQMKKLRAATDRAIIELIRKRVSEEASDEGAQGALAAAVARQEQADRDDD
jgi:coiled-coil domain-containing protein 12